MVQATADTQYVLGHSESELERLRGQADFYADITRSALGLVGIVPGMRVLDAGCGAGDVSLLLAQTVGHSGEVIAVDSAEDAVRSCTERTSSAGFDTVHVLQEDVMTLSLEAPVDAVFGRLLLMHLTDPVRALKNLARQVAPGGVVAFQEFDIGVAGSYPEIPLAAELIGYMREAFRRAGIDDRAGLRLHHYFAGAGLEAPTVWSLGRVEAPPAPASCEMLAGIVRTLLPLMEATGVATAPQIGLDTLQERLRYELTLADAVVMPPLLITAWSRISGAI